jgi:nucleoside-diphosphate-sugar epimerase
MLSHINVGCGEDVSISDLAEIISDIVGFKGKISFDTSKPDGTPRKLMDVRRLTEMGWTARTHLREGIAQTYQWFVNNRIFLREF